MVDSKGKKPTMTAAQQRNQREQLLFSRLDAKYKTSGSLDFDEMRTWQCLAVKFSGKNRGN